MSEPCDLSACEARRQIGRKALSPVELVESCIGRIEAVDGALNAMVTRCFERARSEASAAEDAVMRGDALGALHGLPLGVKDLNVTQGVRTTYGSPLYADNVPDTDERIITVLRAAGAIVIGKTNTPEFGAGANTTNQVFGATGNPFDPKRICGGSSGGSAAAVAAGVRPTWTRRAGVMMSVDATDSSSMSTEPASLMTSPAPGPPGSWKSAKEPSPEMSPSPPLSSSSLLPLPSEPEVSKSSPLSQAASDKTLAIKIHFTRDRMCMETSNFYYVLVCCFNVKNCSTENSIRHWVSATYVQFCTGVIR